MLAVEVHFFTEGARRVFAIKNSAHVYIITQS
jgi:hypothetical protein